MKERETEAVTERDTHRDRQRVTERHTDRDRRQRLAEVKALGLP